MKNIKRVCTAVAAIICLAIQGQVIHAATPMTNPGLVDHIAGITADAVAAKRQSLAEGAFAKLSGDERTAVWSLIADASKLKSSTQGIDSGKLAKLKEVIADMKNNPKFGPAKWMAADGSTFDTYEEYHDYQWGTPPGGFRW